MNKVTFEDILNSSIDFESEEIVVTFEKKVQTKQYESETLRAEIKGKMDRNISGIERIYIENLLHSQLAYSVYCQASYAGYVTQTELINKKEEIVALTNGLAEKLVAAGLGEKYGF